ncbi:MAG: hypothetical protein FJ144_13090 [Deltaproteobacteria bacterium]|nr:hypothetical protein [Deltaproteobacteria bacterium]
MWRFAPFIPFVTSILLSVSADSADACSCTGDPSIAHVYAAAENVVRVKVEREVTRIRKIPGVPTLDGTIRVYRATVKEVFKGCLRRGRTIKLYTATDPGLCGVHLDHRHEYVVALDGGDERAFAIHSCGFVRPVETLTNAEAIFLGTRYSCCGDDCACTRASQASCPDDPCEAESCDGAACETNPCGRCRAEFFDPIGQPACSPCENDFNCGIGQACVAGECVARTECTIDSDCAPDRWCRTTEAGGAACVPFVGEGAECAGFRAPWTVELCAPGLVCKPTNPSLPDLPGSCTL